MPTVRFASLRNASQFAKGMITRGLMEWCPLHYLDTVDEAWVRTSLAESFTEYTVDMVSYIRWAIQNSRVAESLGKKVEALTTWAQKAEEAEEKSEGEKKSLYKEA